MEINIISDNNLCTVHVKGRLTFVDHASFRKMIDQVRETASQQCVLNLHELEFIDSAGLGMLLVLRDTLIKSSGALILKTPRGQVKKMFQVSHFDTMFDIEE